MRKIRLNHNQVFISSKHSRTCVHFHFLVSVPVLFARRRSTAKTFSSCVRNRAVVGEFGMSKLYLESIARQTLLKQDYLQNHDRECNSYEPGKKEDDLNGTRLARDLMSRNKANFVGLEGAVNVTKPKCHDGTDL